MADTYVYIIHEPDWDSDEFLGRPRDHEGSADNKFPEHAAFAEAVAKLGATRDRRRGAAEPEVRRQRGARRRRPQGRRTRSSPTRRTPTPAR